MSKRFLIVNSGLEQVPLIRAAVARGHHVLATHHDAASAEGFEYAHASAIVDPRDVDALRTLALENGIEAVVADQCDYSYWAVAWLATALDLPGPSLDAAQGVTNKAEMRRRLAQAGCDDLQPRWQRADTLGNARAAAADLDYPLVVKPVDNRGNFGVHMVDGPDALDTAVLDALGHSHSRAVVVEGRIAGTLCTVEGFCHGERYVTTTVSHKRPFADRAQVAAEIIYDPTALGTHRDTLVAANQRIVAALGLTHGPTHGEYFLTADGRAMLVEIHNRGGGVHINSIAVPAASGFDTLGTAIDQAAGLDVDLPASDPPPAASVSLRFLHFAPGQVARWRGIDAVRTDAQCLYARMLVPEGGTIRALAGDTTRAGWLVVSGADDWSRQAASDRLAAMIAPEYRHDSNAAADETA